MPSPFVYWHQSECSITLRIDLKSVKRVDEEFGKKKITFKGEGIGALGLHDYEFEYNLIAEIEAEVSYLCYRFNH